MHAARGWLHYKTKHVAEYLNGIKLHISILMFDS